MQKLVLLCANDWEALYVDGKNIGEDHEITIQNVFHHLENCEIIYLNSKQESRLVGNGYFPETLEEFKRLYRV